ncbi:MAG: ABC transporter permease [Candidatus Firestonebacteria bacterium]
MNKIWAITKRELKSYFVSPIAYIVIVVFLLFSAFIFNVIIMRYQIAEIRGIVYNMAFIFLFISPMITMRLLSEERKLGTIELLYTSPITLTSIVVGKYLSSVLLFLVMFLLILEYPIFVLIGGSPDIGPMLSALLGFVLISATCLAVGTFASSLTENQLVSAVIGLGLILLFWLIGMAGDSIGGSVGNFVSSLSIIKHFDDFVKGVIDLGNIFYYLAMIFFFLFITVRRLEWKRW